jgi:hypothetical protein
MMDQRWSQWRLVGERCFSDKISKDLKSYKLLWINKGILLFCRFLIFSSSSSASSSV